MLPRKTQEQNPNNKEKAYNDKFFVQHFWHFLKVSVQVKNKKGITFTAINISPNASSVTIQ